MISENSAKKPKFTAPLLETYPNLDDDAGRDAKTGGVIPSDSQVTAAKRWVEENEL